jgi:hypothetical protein
LLCSAFSLLAPTFALLFLPFQALALPSHFWLPLLPSYFCLFKLLLCLLTFGSHFCPLIFAFSFQAFALLPWHLFFLKQKKRKKKKKEKKIIEKKKSEEKGGSLPFFSRFCIWDEALLQLSPLHIPSTLSPPPSFNIEPSTFLKPCVSRLLEALCYSSLGALPSSGDGMNGK